VVARCAADRARVGGHGADRRARRNLGDTRGRLGRQRRPRRGGRAGEPGAVTGSRVAERTAAVTDARRADRLAAAERAEAGAGRPGLGQ
jgi:hypothetical protein